MKICYRLFGELRNEHAKGFIQRECNKNSGVLQFQTSRKKTLTQNIASSICK